MVQRQCLHGSITVHHLTFYTSEPQAAQDLPSAQTFAGVRVPIDRAGEDL